MSFSTLIKSKDKLKPLMTDDELYLLYKISEAIKGTIYVELGSMYGGSSIFIADAIKKYKDAKLYCVDIFCINGEDAKELFEKNVLKKYSNVELIERTTKDASSLFEEEIDFLLVDADHQEHSVIEDCESWLPKLKSSGMVAFHDYFNDMFPPVRKNVEEYTQGWELMAQVDTMIIKRKP